MTPMVYEITNICQCANDHSSQTHGLNYVFFTTFLPWMIVATPQAAFHVLNKMGSVTAFSIANSVKRGVVILAGVVLMGTPMELVPTLGAVVAVSGTAVYWVARMLFAPRRRRKTPRRQ